MFWDSEASSVLDRAGRAARNSQHTLKGILSSLKKRGRAAVAGQTLMQMSECPLAYLEHAVLTMAQASREIVTSAAVLRLMTKGCN